MNRLVTKENISAFDSSSQETPVSRFETKQLRCIHVQRSDRLLAVCFLLKPGKEYEARRLRLYRPFDFVDGEKTLVGP